jgi:hypothetical protein
MGSVLSSKPQPPEERAALQKEINKVIAENPVVIFSKTWCRTCHVHLMHSCRTCHVRHGPWTPDALVQCSMPCT